MRRKEFVYWQKINVYTCMLRYTCTYILWEKKKCIHLPWLIMMFWFMKCGSFGYFGRWQNLWKERLFHDSISGTYCREFLKKPCKGTCIIISMYNSKKSRRFLDQIIRSSLNREHRTLLTRPEFRSWAEPVGRSASVWPASVRQGDFFVLHGVHVLSRGSGVSIINELYWRALCLQVTTKK